MKSIRIIINGLTFVFIDIKHFYLLLDSFITNEENSYFKLKARDVINDFIVEEYHLHETILLTINFDSKKLTKQLLNYDEFTELSIGNRI